MIWKSYFVSMSLRWFGVCSEMGDCFLVSVVDAVLGIALLRLSLLIAIIRA